METSPFSHVAVCETEVPFRPPLQIIESLPPDSPVVWLDSGRRGVGLGTCSYLCFRPSWRIYSRRGQVFSGPAGSEQVVSRGWFDELGRLLEMWQPCGPRAGQGLHAGFVGYLGYELLHELESVARPKSWREEPPDGDMCLYQVVCSWRRGDDRMTVRVLGFGSCEVAAISAATAQQAEVSAWWDALDTWSPPSWHGALEETASRVVRETPRVAVADLERLGVTSPVSRAQYVASIGEVQDEILRGNAFEVCLTRPLDVSLDADGASLYAVMRMVSPAPMGAYIRTDGVEVLSASPERFLMVSDDGWVETRPIKGTRPRSSDVQEDARWRLELASSRKDRAENIMIVDLARNDLGRVCSFGTVRVPHLCEVESHVNTWQMVSTVRGQLRDDVSTVDVIRAAFPGGSMTGAPKIEAMKIISRLEGTARGVYSGAIGFVDLSGHCDLSIVIRTLVGRDGRWRYQVGGAITTDSDPGEEYQETLDKTRALLTTLTAARECGLVLGCE